MILLDTHIWIWFNLEPEKLPRSIATAFQETDAEFGISAITVWETIVAAQKGRIQTTLEPIANAQAWLDASPIKVFPIDAQIAALSRRLAFTHEDPADRFIAATAFQLNCPLCTTDERLRGLEWLKVM